MKVTQNLHFYVQKLFWKVLKWFTVHKFTHSLSHLRDNKSHNKDKNDEN